MFDERWVSDSIIIRCQIDDQFLWTPITVDKPWKKLEHWSSTLRWQKFLRRQKRKQSNGSSCFLFFHCWRWKQYDSGQVRMQREKTNNLLNQWLIVSCPVYELNSLFVSFVSNYLTIICLAHSGGNGLNSQSRQFGLDRVNVQLQQYPFYLNFVLRLIVLWSTKGFVVLHFLVTSVLCVSRFFIQIFYYSTNDTLIDYISLRIN